MRAERVIARGHVSEIGTHHELVAAGGRYAAMYTTWISHLTDVR